jgi:hypothetical protein
MLTIIFLCVFLILAMADVVAWLRWTRVRQATSLTLGVSLLLSTLVFFSCFAVSYHFGR